MELKSFFVSLGLVAKDLEKNLQNAKGKVREFSSDVEQQGEAFRKVEREAGQSMQRTGEEMDKAGRKAQDLSKEIENTAKTFRDMGRQLQIAGGIIVGALTAAIYKTVRAGDELDKMSQRTGVAVEELSRLGYVAELSGTNLRSLETSITYLHRNIRNVEQGTGTAVRAFQELGISVRNADGTMRPTVDLISDIADGIVNIGDTGTQAAIAMEIFGRSAGPQLLPFLRQGGEAIREYADEADRLGITMSTEQAQAAADFQDALTRLKSVAAALIRDAVVPLIESLEPLVEWVTRAIARFSDWRRDNEALANVLTKFVGAGGLLMLFAGTLLKIGASLLTFKTQLVGANVQLGIMKGLLTSIKGIGVTGFFAGGLIGGAAIGGIYAQAKIVEYLNRDVKELTDNVNKLVESFSDVATMSFRELIFSLGEVQREIAQTEQELRDLREEQTAWWQYVVAAFVARDVGIKRQEAIQDLEDALGSLNEKEKEMLDTMEARVKSEEDLNDAMGDTTRTIGERITALQTLLEYEEINQRQYIAALEHTLRQTELSAEEREKIEKALQSTYLAMFRERRTEEERMRQALDDIEREKVTITERSLAERETAHKRYSDNVIRMANRLRQQYEKELDVGLIRTLPEAERFIAQILEEIADEQIATREELQLELARIEQEGVRERTDILQREADQIASLEEEKSRIRDRYAQDRLALERRHRATLIEELLRYRPIYDLERRSLEDLAQLRLQFLREGDRERRVPFEWEERRLEEVEAALAREEKAQQLEEIISLEQRMQEELIEVERKEKEVRQATIEALEEAARRTAEATESMSESYERMITDMERQAVTIQEAWGQMQIDLSATLTAISQDMNMALWELTGGVHELQEALRDLVSEIDEYRSKGLEGAEVGHELESTMHAFRDEAEGIDIGRPADQVRRELVLTADTLDYLERRSEALGRTLEHELNAWNRSREAFGLTAVSMEELHQVAESVDESIVDIGDSALVAMPQAAEIVGSTVDSMKLDFGELTEEIMSNQEAMIQLQQAIDNLTDKKVTVTVEEVHTKRFE